MDLYKELPSLEFKLEIKERGTRTNVLYKGDFECKIPNTSDLAEMDKRRALMTLGLDGTLEDTTLLYYEKLSYLQGIIIAQPIWWTQSKQGSLLLDANIIAVLYDQAIEKVEAWNKAVWGDAPEEAIAEISSEAEVALEEKAE